MTRLVRIELLKLRTTPGGWVALGITAALTVASVITTILLAGQQGAPAVGTVDNVQKVLGIGSMTSIVMLVMGILVSAGEDRHRTSLSTYLGEPRRGRVLLAKLLTVGGLGLVGGALAFALALGVAVPMYASKGVHHLPVDVAALWLGTTLLTACYGLLGVALGALTRNTVAAVIGGLAWVLVVELAILQPLVPSVAKWLPTGAGVALDRGGQSAANLLPPGIAALVLVGWAAAICLVASRITLRRELR